METTYCDNCGLLHDPDDGDCLGCKLVKENNKMKEFVIDCSVSHNETRYKYRAQVILREIKE